MSVRALIGLDYLVTVAAAGLWVAAAVVLAQRRRPALGTALVFGALAVTLTRLLIVAGLDRAGWPYAQEKVVLALPLLVIPAALAAEWRGVWVGVAAIGAVAGVVVAFVVGYPATLMGSAVVVALAVAAFLFVLGRRLPGTIVLVLALLAGPGWALWTSLRPPASHTGHGTDVSALRLSTADGPVHRFTLTAGHLEVPLADGRTVAALGFNGQVPGPEVRVAPGEIVEVVLHNKDVEEGVTLHWHGYPVPNGDDGVAGVTQDAVRPGGEYVYRFKATKTGTYWYHTHQVSHRGVKLGLYGAFIVAPKNEGTDLTLPVHTLSGVVLPPATLGTPTKGTPVRARLINTDDVSHRIAVLGTPWRLSAVDGTDLAGPSLVADKALVLPAGGRADLTFDMPSGPVNVMADGAPFLALGGSLGPVPDQPALDVLNYGTPSATSVSYGREYILVLDRQLRFLGGLPQYAYTINGQVWPSASPLVVREGEQVKLTIVNRDKEAHPMHPHGHQVLVLARDGVPAHGSPVWTDSFLVEAGQTWEVLLRADNPGLWMFHCHNLPHAVKGMMLHLSYEGISSGYRLGADNHPE